MNMQYEPPADRDSWLEHRPQNQHERTADELEMAIAEAEIARETWEMLPGFGPGHPLDYPYSVLGNLIPQWRTLMNDCRAVVEMQEREQKECG